MCTRARGRERSPCPGGGPSRLRGGRAPFGKQPHPLTQSGHDQQPRAARPGRRHPRDHTPSPHLPLPPSSESPTATSHRPKPETHGPLRVLLPLSIMTHNPFRAQARRSALFTTHPRTSQPRPEPSLRCRQGPGNMVVLNPQGSTAQGAGFPASTPSPCLLLCSQLHEGTPPGAFTHALPSPAPTPAASSALGPPSPWSARGTRRGLMPRSHRSSPPWGRDEACSGPQLPMPGRGDSHPNGLKK